MPRWATRFLIRDAARLIGRLPPALPEVRPLGRALFQEHHDLVPLGQQLLQPLVLGPELHVIYPQPSVFLNGF